MKPIDRLLGDLYDWRCPACAQGLHDECDPLIPWMCICGCGLPVIDLPAQPQGEP